MKLVVLIKVFANCAFLIQYYLLLTIVFIKNLFLKITFHPKSKLDNFSCNPLNTVHPHVFIDSRNFNH